MKVPFGSGAAPVLSPLLGGNAPPIVGQGADGRPVDALRPTGKWVVANFFASWCGPCRKEFPTLVSFAAAHQDTVMMVGIVHADSEGAARRFAQENGATWEVISDKDERIAQSYFLLGLPYTVVVSPDRRVEATLLGGVKRGDLESIILKDSSVAG